MAGVSRPELLGIGGGVLAAVLFILGLIFIAERGSLDSAVVMTPEELAAANPSLASRQIPTPPQESPPRQPAAEPAPAPPPAATQVAVAPPSMAPPPAIDAPAEAIVLAAREQPPPPGTLAATPIEIRAPAKRTLMRKRIGLKTPRVPVLEVAAPAETAAQAPSALPIAAAPKQPSPVTETPVTEAPQVQAPVQTIETPAAPAPEPTQINAAPQTQTAAATTEPAFATPPVAGEAITNAVGAPGSQATSNAQDNSGGIDAPVAASMSAPPLRIVIAYQSAAPGAINTASQLADALRAAGLKSVETLSSETVVAANEVRYFTAADQNEAADLRRLIAGAKDPQGNPRAFAISDFSRSATSGAEGRLEIWLRSW